MSISDVTSILVTILIAVGFGLVVYVQLSVSQKAENTAKIHENVLLSTQNAVVDSKDAIDKSREILNEVASKTDGRLTQVIEEAAAFRHIADELREQLRVEREYREKQQEADRISKSDREADARATARRDNPEQP